MPEVPDEAVPAAQARPLRFHDIRHTTASLLIMAGADLAAVQRIMRHTDPRITMEFYAHLAPGYLRNAIDRLAINPAEPDAEAAPVAATAATDSPPDASDSIEFAAPLLQPPDSGDLAARADSEKRPAFADLSGSGIPGSNRRHSAWESRFRDNRRSQRFTSSRKCSRFAPRSSPAIPPASSKSEEVCC